MTAQKIEQDSVSRGSSKSKGRLTSISPSYCSCDFLNFSFLAMLSVSARRQDSQKLVVASLLLDGKYGISWLLAAAIMFLKLNLNFRVLVCVFSLVFPSPFVDWHFQLVLHCWPVGPNIYLTTCSPNLWGLKIFLPGIWSVPSSGEFLLQPRLGLASEARNQSGGVWHGPHLWCRVIEQSPKMLIEGGGRRMSCVIRYYTICIDILCMWLGILTVDPVDRNTAGCEAISSAEDLKNTSLAWLPANQQHVGLGLFFLRWLKCYCINTCWSQMTPETMTMSLCGETVYLVCEKQCKSAVDDLWKVFPVFACSHHFPCCRFKWMTETVILGDLGHLMALELACVLFVLKFLSSHQQDLTMGGGHCGEGILKDRALWSWRMLEQWMDLPLHFFWIYLLSSLSIPSQY